MKRKYSSKGRALRVLAATTCAAALVTLAPARALALFHLAETSEIITSYGGDPNVQFVEVNMDTVAENFTMGIKLNVFDTAGNFIGTVLTVGSDVQSGANRKWIMGTPAFETASGLTVDFQFPNASLPVSGGMVCWGKPGGIPTPVSCPGSGTPYVDCVAYGNYTGPSNNCIGTPISLTPEGHSLQRVAETDNNANDFACGDPATPENNAMQTVNMAATSACPVCGNDLTEFPPEQCDGTDDGACVGLCLATCRCAVCGDNDVNTVDEECDGTDDSACPGKCTGGCTCAVCGNGVAETPIEDCDTTDDTSCSGACLPPGNPGECQCPAGPLDHYLCYKTSVKREISATLADVYDNGTYTSKGVKRFCAPADAGSGTSEPLTYLTVSPITGPHAPLSNVQIQTAAGTFSLDTTKVDSLMMPATKSFAPSLPPGPVSSDSVVDHYRCLKPKYTKGSTPLPAGTVMSLDDAFGTRDVEIKKPAALCIATDKNGEGIYRPDSHLLCYKVKPATKHSHADVWMRDQVGAVLGDLKGEAQLCVPATLP